MTTGRINQVTTDLRNCTARCKEHTVARQPTNRTGTLPYYRTTDITNCVSKPLREETNPCILPELHVPLPSLSTVHPTYYIHESPGQESANRKLTFLNAVKHTFSPTVEPTSAHTVVQYILRTYILQRTPQEYTPRSH